ncbi:MAG: hypothetical protein HYV36_01750 [Lentisphaerae bacterium]|nr:hypothetical protein [Lentisphaerota bacterium]
MQLPIAIAVLVMLAARALSQETNAPPAAAADRKPQTTCPVMEGKRIEKIFYVDYEGYRIYLCCKPCVKAARKNPEKYLKILQAQGVTLEKAPENTGTTKR